MTKRQLISLRPSRQTVKSFCFLTQIYVHHFCRAMLCKRGQLPCRHAVCLSVCLLRSCIMLKRINLSFFHRRERQTILLLPYQTSLQYSDGEPLTGASNAGGVGRNCDSEPISGSITCCELFERQVQYTQLRRPWRGELMTLSLAVSGGLC